MKSVISNKDLQVRVQPHILKVVDAVLNGVAIKDRIPLHYTCRLVRKGTDGDSPFEGLVDRPEKDSGQNPELDVHQSGVERTGLGLKKLQSH